MLHRHLHLVALLAFAWCVMAFTHELGHLVGGWCCGGTLEQAELRPWRLPHSRFVPDPHPLVTLWAGPLLGVAVPVALAALLQRRWAWMVAYFCVLANGLYLALAWMSGDRWLDTPRLLAAGASPLSIALYCLATIGFGYVNFRRSVIELLWPPASTSDSPSDLS